MEGRCSVVRALKESGKKKPVIGCSRWSINACEWTITADVRRLWKGAPSFGENPARDPSANIALLLRSSMHDDGLSAILGVQCIKLSRGKGQVTA